MEKQKSPKEKTGSTTTGQYPEIKREGSDHIDMAIDLGIV